MTKAMQNKLCSTWRRMVRYMFGRRLRGAEFGETSLEPWVDFIVRAIRDGEKIMADNGART